MSASNQISISCLYAEQRANPWESVVSLECVCVCVSELLLCVAYIFTYHVSYLCHWVSLMFKVIQRKKEKKCVYSQSWLSTITQNSAFSSVKHIYFRYYTMAQCCVYHTKINNSPKVEFLLSQSAFGFCRIALLCMPITVRIRPYWLGIGIIFLLISIKEGALSRLRL